MFSSLPTLQRPLSKKHSKLELGSDPGLESPETGREDFLITPAGAWLLFLAQLGNVVMFVI